MTDLQETLIYCFENYALKVDGGPLLENPPVIEEEMVTIKWENGENQEEVVLPSESLSEATINGSRYLVVDINGHRTELTFFNVSIASPNEIHERSLHVLRAEEAEWQFENAEFELDVEATGGWESSGDVWTQTVFFQNPSGGDSIKGSFVVHFLSNDSYVDSAGANYGK